MKVWLNDPKDGTPSVTLTLTVMGFVVATFKLLVSGIKVGAFTWSQFSGTDFAAVVGALGAMYVARRFNSTTNTSDAPGDSSGPAA